MNQHFDDIFSAVLALFEISTTEGWVCGRTRAAVYGRAQLLANRAALGMWSGVGSYLSAVTFQL